MLAFCSYLAICICGSAHPASAVEPVEPASALQERTVSAAWVDILTQEGIFTGVVRNPSPVKLQGPFAPWVRDAFGVSRSGPHSVLVNQIRRGPQADLVDVLAALSARPVTEGANVVLVHPRNDAELRFRQRPFDTWLAANTRLYLDAVRDPRRGAEQAAIFREAVLGF